MSHFSDRVLQRGEALLARVVTSHGDVLMATPSRLVVLDVELGSLISILWRDVEAVTLSGLFSTKLRLVAEHHAMTMTIPSRQVDGARRLVDAFLRSRAAPPMLRLVRTQPASLEGAWRLLAVEGRSEGRIISMPFGAHPIGHLVYMRDGRMSVMLMAAERAKFGSHGLRAGTGPEKAAAFDSFLAYSGRYERLEDRVVHYPDVASIPDFVGVPEERFVSLECDRLVLSTPPMPEAGRVLTFAVVWQRAEAFVEASDHAGATMRMSRAG